MIAEMDQPRQWHTVLHIRQEIKAYVVGGQCGLFNQIRECLEFDVLNMKYKYIGELNDARSYCGAIKSQKYLWVFGGYNNRDVALDSIERLDLDSSGSSFIEILLENQILLS